MRLDLSVVARNIRQADTEDLLDRVTVYRDDMEGAALDLIEGELDRRGVGRDEIAAHQREREATALRRPDGSFVRCTFCDRPAVLRAWGWRPGHWLIPYVPGPFRYCGEHARETGRLDMPAGDDR
jgi:hypothetical protein